ncbi:helix-turn-helix domain-containing protein [Microbacterium arborescens]
MTESSAHDPLVDVREMARILSVSTDTVYRWARGGHIPAIRVGGRWRFLTAEVVESVRHIPDDPWQQSERSRSARRLS